VVSTLPAEMGKEYPFTLLREGTFFFGLFRRISGFVS